jgi:hypothetical protein
MLAIEQIAPGPQADERLFLVVVNQCRHGLLALGRRLLGAPQGLERVGEALSQLLFEARGEGHPIAALAED